MGNSASSNNLGPLALAVIEDDLDAMKEIVRADTGDVHMRDEMGRSLLHLAAARGNEMVVKYLCAIGVSLHCTDRQKRTALFYACEAGNTSAVVALCSAGADVNYRDSAGYTPLMLAVLGSQTEAVRALLKTKGISIGIKCPNGRTACTMARDRDEAAILELLSTHFELTSRRGEGAYDYALDVQDAPAAVKRDGPVAFHSQLPSRGGLEGASLHMEAGRYEAAIALLNVLIRDIRDRKNRNGAPEESEALEANTLLRADCHLLRGEALLSLSQHEASASDFSLALGLLARDDRIRRALAGRASATLARGQAVVSTHLLRDAVSDLELAVRLAEAVESVNPLGSASSQSQVDTRGWNGTSPASLRRMTVEAQNALEAADASYTRPMASEDKDHYTRLKISRSASAEDIRAAYRTLSRSCHPDKMLWADPRARERSGVKFRRLTSSYAVLTDPTRRAFYDMELTAKKSLVS